MIKVKYGKYLGEDEFGDDEYGGALVECDGKYRKMKHLSGKRIKTLFDRELMEYWATSYGYADEKRDYIRGSDEAFEAVVFAQQFGKEFDERVTDEKWLVSMLKLPEKYEKLYPYEKYDGGDRAGPEYADVIGDIIEAFGYEMYGEAKKLSKDIVGIPNKKEQLEMVKHIQKNGRLTIGKIQREPDAYHC